MPDECDFDQTLRNMLSMPPNPHQRKPERDDGDDVIEPHESDTLVPDEDERG